MISICRLCGSEIKEDTERLGACRSCNKVISNACDKMCNSYKERLDLNKEKPFSRRDAEVIEEWIGLLSISELAVVLGRSKKWIIKSILKLGSQYE